MDLTPQHRPTRTDDSPTARVRTIGRMALDSLRHVPDDGVERLTRSMERAEAMAASGDDTEVTMLSRWLAATSAPAYARAADKLLRDPENGHREFDAEELAAYRTARQVQRAMSIGTPSAGGFMLPTHLDPSVMLSSAGSIDPMRKLARHAMIATNEWHGISSAGVTANWYAEAAEVTDDSPTLADPSVPTHRASAFVAASIEAADDTAIRGELAGLFADAKAQLEASAFVTGTGADQPTGLVTALAGGSSEVATAAAGAYARGDVVGLQEAVPPRFRSRAAFIMALETLNASREFPKLTGGVDESLVDDGGNVPRIRGWAVHEHSQLDATLTTGSNIAVAGDFSQYLIVDRVGTTIEYIPHLLGANRRPSGQRGWFMWFRTGGDVLVANALRLLTVA